LEQICAAEPLAVKRLVRMLVLGDVTWDCGDTCTVSPDERDGTESMEQDR
jgi:hypothetical protein